MREQEEFNSNRNLKTVKVQELQISYVMGW